jgi:hypothetical protein
LPLAQQRLDGFPTWTIGAGRDGALGSGRPADGVAASDADPPLPKIKGEDDPRSIGRPAAGRGCLKALLMGALLVKARPVEALLLKALLVKARQVGVRPV